MNYIKLGGAGSGCGSHLAVAVLLGTTVTKERAEFGISEIVTLQEGGGVMKCTEILKPGLAGKRIEFGVCF